MDVLDNYSFTGEMEPDFRKATRALSTGLFAHIRIQSFRLPILVDINVIAPEYRSEADHLCKPPFASSLYFPYLVQASETLLTDY